MLPKQLPPTTQGKIITCNYFLRVELRTQGFWGPFVTDLKMKVPVVVYPPQPQAQFFAQPPADWKPSQASRRVQFLL